MRRDRRFWPPPSTRRRAAGPPRAVAVPCGAPAAREGRPRGLAFLLGIKRYRIARVPQT